jgi:hypothetical protein
VSIYSLRKVYDGPITVVANDNVPHEFTEKLKTQGVTIRRVSREDEDAGTHKTALLMKCAVNIWAPYDVNVFLDCDTLVLKPFDELFGWAEEHSLVFCQFANWKASKRAIANRIKQLGPDGKGAATQEEVDAAIAYPAAVNIGVFAFKQDATMFDEWYDLAIQGMDLFIPDEAACQVLLPKHEHYLAPQIFNHTCNKLALDPDARVLHYHGKKHVYLEKTHGTAQHWIDCFREAYELDWMDMKEIYNKWRDHHMKRKGI